MTKHDNVPQSALYPTEKHTRKQNDLSQPLSKPLVELQVDHKHKCVNESPTESESAGIKKQKLSTQRILKAAGFSDDRSSSKQASSLSLQQMGNEALSSSTQLTAILESSLSSGRERIDFSAQVQLSYNSDPSSLISEPYPSSALSPTDFLSRVPFPHSGTESRSGTTKNPDTSDSARLPQQETTSSSYSLHHLDTHKEEMLDTVLKHLHSNHNDTDSTGYHKFVDAARDPSVVPTWVSSSFDKEGSLASASAVDLGDSDASMKVKLEIRDPEISKFQTDNSDIKCDVSESFGLSSGDSEVHGLEHNLEDFRNDSNALLKCLNHMSSKDLYSHLQRIDPDTSSRMHPNNRRKIVRAIQIYYECGRTMSSILNEQHDGLEDVKSGPLRYSDPCILWVKCQRPELNERLDSRVDDMMARGLVAELENFHKEALRLEALKQKSSSEDQGCLYPHGVLQMIGFKEFDEYLQLSPEERNTEDGQKLLQQGISDLKQATRRYARQQVRWITNRFCNRPGPNVPPIYSVDSTDLTQWGKAVEEAIDVVRAFVAGKTPIKAPEMVSCKVDARFERNVCDVCEGRVFLHMHEWKDHLKSKKHKMNVRMTAAARKELSHLLSAREQQLKQMIDMTVSLDDAEGSENSQC